MRADFWDIRDPRILRAIAHPLRLALLDLLDRDGTLTSAEASTATGESTASCSFHLRQLAKYGFIERAEGADRRERRWKRAVAGERVSDPVDGPLARAASEVLSIAVQRVAGEASRWVDGRGDLPPRWQVPGVVDVGITHLTSAELSELTRAVTSLVAVYADRAADPARRPPRSRPVRTAMLLFPLPPDDQELETRWPTDPSRRATSRRRPT